jgi:uncharacterized protein
MSDALKSEISDFLSALGPMTVATANGDTPWASSVFFAHDDDLNLYFLSSPETRHSTNIAGNIKVAASIVGDEKDWTKIRGAQVEGTAVQVPPSEITQAADVYFGKYPGFREMVGAAEGADEEALVAALQYVHIYKITPRMIRMIDNGKGFAHKEELVLGA